jgi:lipoprotein LprA
MHTKHFSLAHVIALFSSSVALAVLLMGCGGSNSSAPSAQQLIRDAQVAIGKVTSYHFTLKSQNIGTTGSLPIQSADGDIVVPDRLQANADVVFNGGNAQAQIIAIGNTQYVNVLGSWQQTSGLLDPRVLSDPQTGVAALLGHVQNPDSPGESNSNGTPCWNITGKLQASYLAGITGGGVPAGTTDDVTVCIGKNDTRPYLIVIKGIAAAGDTAQTVRTFTLSKFNEQITIVPPAGAGTPVALPTATP